MHVIKRNGKREAVYFDKITERLKNLSWGLDVEATYITNKVIDQISADMSTSDIDTLAGEVSQSLVINHPDYGTLAARIEISNLHKMTSESFSHTMGLLHKNVHAATQEPSPMISDKILQIIMKNSKIINKAIDYERDYLFDYFAIKTLMKSYLTSINGKVVERPQHMWMRVSIGIHLDDMDAVLETYNLLSQKYFIHASPTLFNAASLRPQMSSCFFVENGRRFDRRHLRYIETMRHDIQTRGGHWIVNFEY